MAVLIVPEPPEAPRGNADGPTLWWEQYLASIRQMGRVSSAALVELERLSRSICDRLPPAGTNGGRTCGALVGAVQSGKTGIIGAVAARALDAGYRIIVVLSGLRDDLRTQTARRLKRELLAHGDRLYDWRSGQWVASDPPRYDHPAGRGSHGACRSFWSPHFKDDISTDQAFASLFIRALRQDKRVVLVVKKNPRVLERLHSALVDARRAMDAATLSMLVLDDECDEASIADAATERPTAESVESLVLAGGSQTVAYIGVTATIAANILQDPSHVLFPRDFVEVARYPAERDTVLTFREPDPTRRYTGGHAYYRMLEEAGYPNFLVQATISDAEQAGVPGHDRDLTAAIMAYFVSAAMRHSSEISFDDPLRLPPPHTMMLHSDGRILHHESLARRVIAAIATAAGAPVDPASLKLDRDPENRLDPTHLLDWLSREEAQWHEAYQSFWQARQVLDATIPGMNRPRLPSWATTRQRLPEVFRHTKLRIINSDDSMDEGPLDFGSPGSGTIPYDLYSIVIGGNRLSRGLTIEGLCISYFTRSSSGVVAEDTATQRARWLGYRGRHLEFCRVFLHRDTALAFERFYEHDIDLRRQFAWMLAEGRTPADTAVRVRCLPNSRPTAQVGVGQGVRVSFSGSRWFMPHVEMGRTPLALRLAQANQALAASWWTRLVADGALIGGDRPRGVMVRAVPAHEVTQLLNAFQFSDHNPDPSDGLGAVLRHVHREPDPERRICNGLPFTSCPYVLAAYLRYWAEAYGSARIAHQAESPSGPDGVSRWVPLPPPSFNVVFRLGDWTEEVDGPFGGARLLNRAILPSGEVTARWGGHGASDSNPGDEWLDLTPPGGDPHQPRSPDQPGLILLHVAHRDAVGRHRAGNPPIGVAYPWHRPFLGASIPQGGPTIDAVISRTGS